MRLKESLTLIVVGLLVMSILGIAGGIAKRYVNSFDNVSIAEDNNVIEIYDWHDLDGVRDNLNANYILMNDLDEDTEGYGELVDTRGGWDPVGEYDIDVDVEFTGTFDGNGYRIKNLFIDKGISERHIGLFGATDDDAKITDVSLVDVNIMSGKEVGGIVGINRGTIENSSVSGDVSGGNHVGGLVGYNFGTVSKSYATANVWGGNRAGGLVGRNPGRVTKSHATGDVDAGHDAGGLIGVHFVTISNSYSTGDVSGINRVGGLVGQNYGGEVFNCYSIGKVSGEDDVGGLIGFNFAESVHSSFWDIERSNQGDSDGNGRGKTTEELKDIDTFTDESTEGLRGAWDFVGNPNDDDEDKNIWDIDNREEINDGYPFLTWEEVEDVDKEDDIPGFTLPTLALSAVLAIAISTRRKGVTSKKFFLAFLYYF